MAAGPTTLTLSNLKMPIDGGRDFVDFILLFSNSDGNKFAFGLISLKVKEVKDYWTTSVGTTA